MTSDCATLEIKHRTKRRAAMTLRLRVYAATCLFKMFAIV